MLQQLGLSFFALLLVGPCGAALLLGHTLGRLEGLASEHRCKHYILIVRVGRYGARHLCQQIQGR